jgi:exosortase
MSEIDPVSRGDEFDSDAGSAPVRPGMDRRRVMSGLVAVAVLCLGFAPVFLDWYRSAMVSDLHSHVLLIPVVCVYLLVIGRSDLVWDSKPSPVGGGVLMGISALLLGWVLVANPAWSQVDLVAVKLVAFVGLLWGIGLLIMGKRWMGSALFPAGFLIFMIPLPDAAVEHLEQFLMVLSAWLSELLFSWGGIPVFKQGQVLELPGIVLEVAQECSGIRSSWVLLITSVLAAYLFLPTVPRRIALVAAVLPLAILRNATRIFVIGWMCVYQGPEMIDSWVHRKGGPLFFAASLVPLFLLAWWLRSRGPKSAPQDSAGDGS